MNIAPFTEDPRVLKALDRLHNECRGREFSDIVDGSGRQYVDLVLEGGGVLGIALTGYTYALEQAGIRFLRIGGTSVGAINALLIAAVAPPSESKTSKLLPYLAELPMDSFVDGRGAVRRFIDCWRRGRSWQTYVRIIPVAFRFWWTLGLCRGDQITHWLTDVLNNEGIRTTGDLLARMNDLPNDLTHRDPDRSLTDEDLETCLKLVAADVTTETKAIFPEMAELYFGDPEAINPALFVRASMSVPFLFKPLRVRNLPNCKETIRAWREKGYGGKIPDEVLFVDGGMMSNFPIELFHASGVPIAPTFGVKLGFDRHEARRIQSPLQLSWAVLDAARRAGDFDFIQKNPDYDSVVHNIDTLDFHWLDFALDRESQITLFAQGVQAATDFLVGFDWENYKEIRANVDQAQKLHDSQPAPTA